MQRSNAATLLYLLLVFTSGVMVGGFANRLYMMKTVSAHTDLPKTRAQVRKEYLQEMRTRLHLTDPQVSQLQQIMEVTGRRFHDLHKSIEDEHVQKVIAILDDSQKAEYAKMREERDRHRQQQARK
jgi:uncharacterized protein (DUF2236 family)